MNVIFEVGRDGAPMCRIGGKVSFPERRGVKPAVGDEWEVEITGQNKSGSVNFLRLVRRVGGLVDKVQAIWVARWRLYYGSPAIPELDVKIIDDETLHCRACGMDAKIKTHWLRSSVEGFATEVFTVMYGSELVSYTQELTDEFVDYIRATLPGASIEAEAAKNNLFSRVENNVGWDELVGTAMIEVSHPSWVEHHDYLGKRAGKTSLLVTSRDTIETLKEKYGKFLVPNRTWYDTADRLDGYGFSD